MQQISFSSWAPPAPPVYSAPPHHLTGLKEPTSKGKRNEGTGWEGKGKEGKKKVEEVRSYGLIFDSSHTKSHKVMIR